MAGPRVGPKERIRPNALFSFVRTPDAARFGEEKIKAHRSLWNDANKSPVQKSSSMNVHAT
jgi:hypothetical protein